MTDRAAIDAFLAGTTFAVAGASNDRNKYGNKVLRCYWQAGRKAHPINPNRDTIEGARCFPSTTALAATEPIDGLSLITQPAISTRVIEDAAEAGVRHVWFQPGAESEEALATAERHGMSVVAHGPCLLVVLGFREGSGGQGPRA